jgi:hypothetical protein
MIRMKFIGTSQHGDWKLDEIGTYLSMTYQDVGPVIWIIKDDGYIVGAFPTQVRVI